MHMQAQNDFGLSGEITSAPRCTFQNLNPSFNLMDLHHLQIIACSLHLFSQQMSNQEFNRSGVRSERVWWQFLALFSSRSC
jgi:hypothetical protein